MKDALSALEELQQAKGAKAKEAVLKTHKNDTLFQMLLYYACHPRATYKLSEATLDKEWPEVRGAFDDGMRLFEWCGYLNTRPSLSDGEVATVATWLNDQPEDERKWYRAILTKTLRLGVTHKTINKVIPGLFPEWDVQQAYPIEKYPLKEGEWFAVTEKLNGVRGTFYRGQLIARSGEVFTGLEHITNELGLRQDVVFDGELTLKDKTGLTDNEAFRKATGILNSDGDKSAIKFTIFDMLDADEFDDGESLNPYRERRIRLDRFGYANRLSESVSVLPCLYQGTEQAVIDRLLKVAVSADKEGLMVNRDTVYKCKRHPGILKVKRFYTMDLPILRVEEGTGKYKGMMGCVVVGYKGNEVGVGTGFTDEQRRTMWEQREELSGVLAEVKYKEISRNKQTGAESLQFPVFVQLRADKSEVSYG